MPRHLRRRIETLIPVSLRLLDESGRHRIAGRMLGITTEVSGYELTVSVMGRSGRPLSYGLATRQKVVVSFLATELHEKVESLVCELQSVVPISGQTDAWKVRLLLPALMPELSEDILTALARYGRRPQRTVSGWTAAGLMLAAAAGAAGAASWFGNQALERQQRQTERLRAQLAFSTQTVDQLARSLEDADRQLELQQGRLAAADELQAVIGELEAENAALQDRLADAKDTKVTPPKIQLSGVSLTDFRTVRSIRGAATAPRLAYRDGTLELLAATPEHRRVARNAGRLLLAYAQQTSATLRRRGSWSLESTDGTIGIETAEAFVVGDAPKERPDFVFEARNPATGSWLSAYASIGIPEVWLWSNDRLEFLSLVDGAYVSIPRSALLPDLDPGLFAQYVDREDPAEATREFMQRVAPRASAR